MKNKLKYTFLALAFTLATSACSSNKSENRTSDSIDSVNDSIQNDTGALDLTSQADTIPDDGAGVDTSGM